MWYVLHEVFDTTTTTITMILYTSTLHKLLYTSTLRYSIRVLLRTLYEYSTLVLYTLMILVLLMFGKLVCCVKVSMCMYAPAPVHINVPTQLYIE